MCFVLLTRQRWGRSSEHIVLCMSSVVWPDWRVKKVEVLVQQKK